MHVILNLISVGIIGLIIWAVLAIEIIGCDNVDKYKEINSFEEFEKIE